MSTTNFGNQKISFRFKEELKATEFARHLNNVIPFGIYTGGTLTNSGNNITITPFDVVLRASSTQFVSVNTENAVSVSVSLGLTIAAATPYVVASYVYNDVISNFLDFNFVSQVSITANHIVFGKAVFTGANVTSFDYSEATYPPTYDAFTRVLTVKGITEITNSTQSTTKDTGALIVTNGGVGVEGNVTAGGAITSITTVSGNQVASTVATGTTPLLITSTTKVTNLNVDRIDDCNVETTLTPTSDSFIPTSRAIRDYAFPVGAWYTQYADVSGTFVSGKDPQSLFGGAWTIRFNGDSTFFRTEGSTVSQTRTSGKSADQFQGHTFNIRGDNGGGSDPTIIGSTQIGTTVYYLTHPLVLTTLSPYSAPRIGDVTEPINRLIRVYERTS